MSRHVTSPSSLLEHNKYSYLVIITYLAGEENKDALGRVDQSKLRYQKDTNCPQVFLLAWRYKGSTNQSPVSEGSRPMRVRHSGNDLENYIWIIAGQQSSTLTDCTHRDPFNPSSLPVDSILTCQGGRSYKKCFWMRTASLEKENASKNSHSDSRHKFIAFTHFSCRYDLLTYIFSLILILL